MKSVFGKRPKGARSEPQASEVSSWLGKRPKGARSEPQASEVSSWLGKRPKSARREGKAEGRAVSRRRTKSEGPRAKSAAGEVGS